MSLPPPSNTLDDAEKGDIDLSCTLPPTPVPPAYLKESSSSSTLDNSKSRLDVTWSPVTPTAEAKALAQVPKLPSKPAKRKISRWIKAQLWFNAYRRFFTFVLVFNLTVILITAINVWSYPRHYIGAWVLGNLQVSILTRNELFGRCLYLIVNTCFAEWTPLWFRLACTSTLQHLGGIHSGCAVSGFLWLIFKITVIFIDHKNEHDAVLVAGVITNLAVAISIASAFPWVRNTHHNLFERHHRFVGWLGLLATWVFVVLGDSYDLDLHQWNPDGVRVLRQQDLWFIFIMTVFTMIPWFTIREVSVEIEIPSPKVAIIKFERGMQQGLLTRIARGSIMEYHAFGTISEGTKSGCHYVIAGVQGDFTRSLVDNPPTRLWTRQLKFAGVGHTSTLYKRGIRVCTGTGLGAALSTCLQNPNWYLIWIGSDQHKTFGPTIYNLIHDNIPPERMTLWDSRERGGRPDTIKLITETYHAWKAEVVMITSNWQGNKEMTEGLKDAGIPVFGTLWDF